MPEIKVLVADDEIDFLESLTKTLARRGFKVTTAVNGQKAVEIHLKERFDVILLDLRMPVMDGFIALQEIRKSDKTTPVILLSGHADVAYVAKALKEGACDYLLKPCAVENIASALETASERKAIIKELKDKTDKNCGR